MAEEYTYLTSGANQSLVRTAGDEVQFDSANIDTILEAGSISDKQVKNISADKITAGTFSAITKVGDTSVSIDGEQKRIIVNDGTNDRVLIGKAVGLF
jgi:hypothetical protein